MHKKLKLGLARYKVIWSLEKAYAVMQELDEVIKTLPQGSSDELAILRLHVELTREFRAYFDYLTG
ncbi:hypothetical protein DPH57_21305 [Massilia sp. YMA4]|nr:hypothetical protein DPH57_21305 [Massilia sp. YMA4]